MVKIFHPPLKVVRPPAVEGAVMTDGGGVTSTVGIMLSLVAVGSISSTVGDTFTTVGDSVGTMTISTVGLGLVVGVTVSSGIWVSPVCGVDVDSLITSVGEICSAFCSVSGFDFSEPAISETEIMAEVGALPATEFPW